VASPGVILWGVAGRVVAVALISLLMLGCGKAGPNGQARTPPKSVITGSGRLVDIGGRSLALDCVGSGSPTVVLEAGFGGSSTAWSGVQPGLGETTRTCSYDRAGLGSSLAIPGVHDAADEIRDLERLLTAAHLPPPYVLVGHSYGGLLVRLFAYSHPADTAGVVLVDALGRDATRRQLAIWPRSVARARRREWAQPVVDGVDLQAGEALADRVRALGHTPLVVITAGIQRDQNANLPASLARAQERLWSTLQDELGELSRDHMHVVALRSDHFVQSLDGQPEVVIRAVRAVIRASREHAQLPPCARLFTGPGVRCRG
jgi:pimeloyl-ACP methyl ester carboxylesterase